jgi:hypothetical protein
MLEFLNQITANEVTEQPATAKGGSNQKKERIPSGSRIRVFRDGSVYPSQKLVDKFDLEYGPKDCDGCGNGFDVIDSDKFSEFKVPKRLLWVSPVSRNVKAGKVDLFAAVSYNTDNSPKSSVLNQGANTYGKAELLPMLKEVYGLELTKDSNPDYIDLELVTNPATGEPWQLTNGKQVTYVPKKMTRGDKKGEPDAVRREKPEFYVLYPVSLIEAETKPEGQEGLQEADTEDDTHAKLLIDKAAKKHSGALVVE